MRTLLGVLIVAVLLATAAPREAEGQQLDRRSRGWLSVDAFATSYQLEGSLSSGARAVAGGGLRVMFTAAPLLGLELGFLERTAIGGFMIYTPTADNVRTWHFGGQVDYRLFGEAAGGVFDPLLSLGAGAVRVDTPDAPAIVATDGSLAVSETFATLVPGLGARLHVARGIALRTDIRDVIVFGRQTRHNWELSGGLSLLF